MSTDVRGPLSGIKVIDLTQWMQGGFMGAFLGDLGADVIKVENTTGGDAQRGVVDITKTLNRQESEINWAFEACNRRKRSIALDLRQEKGREIVYKLVKEADIFVHNFRVGVTERLGIDYETLAAYNPKLIYLHASGWGTEGPLAGEPAYEFVAMARAGFQYLVGTPDSPPDYFVVGVGDTTGAMVGVMGILAALVSRELHGIGQKVEVSLFSSLITTLENAAIHCKLLTGDETQRRERDNVGNPLVAFYRCSDNKWIRLGMLQPDRYWSAFCKVLGIIDLQDDPRFKDIFARSHNAKELISILNNIFASKPRDEWQKLCTDNGLIAAPVQTISEVVEDPQALANQCIIDFNSPILGPTKVVGFPYKFSKTPLSLTTGAPQYGQHTEEILLELGFNWDNIAQLKEQGIIL